MLLLLMGGLGSTDLVVVVIETLITFNFKLIKC